MKTNVDLFVGVSITKEDWSLYNENLIASLLNIYNAFNGDCTAFIVLQDKSLHETISVHETYSWIYIQTTNVMGVSNARNLCIETSIKLNSHYLLFHDATIYWPLSTASFMYTYKSSGITPRVSVKFCELTALTSDELSYKNTVLIKTNPMYNTYVGSYLLEVGKIGQLRFDVNFGPGESTKFKSGEDVLFLFKYFRTDNHVIAPNDSSLAVYHPPRPKDYSKHLLYAYGQGALFRELFRSDFNFQLLLDFILFFGNASLRCLILRKNAFKIFWNRLKGFIGA